MYSPCISDTAVSAIITAHTVTTINRLHITTHRTRTVTRRVSIITIRIFTTSDRTATTTVTTAVITGIFPGWPSTVSTMQATTTVHRVSTAGIPVMAFTTGFTTHTGQEGRSRGASWAYANVERHRPLPGVTRYYAVAAA